MSEKTGAALNRGKSIQEVGTDPKFMTSVIRRFGYIGWDLAASEENRKSINGYYSKEDDSLIQKWHELPTHGVLWLNPEYSNIEPWVAKCAAESALVCKPILCLVPASVGANWFKQWVLPSAHVIALNGRLTFEGHKDPYPRDMILAVYFAGLTGFSVWSWQK